MPRQTSTQTQTVMFGFLLLWNLRHKTEFPSGFDSFSFLDIVSRDGALSAHCVPRSVPVWILKQPHTRQHNIIINATNRCEVIL